MQSALHLNLESLEDIRSKGYFLVDAIKCRLDKKDKSSVSSAVLERCSAKFLSRELRVLKPKTIVVVGNSAKKALEIERNAKFLRFQKTKKTQGNKRV